ncbi:nitroreductase [Streptomyces triticagri]|uniref:Nitroreductase n=1 Tax=Streptomyces triticagri TaxID=2293568 RepID=A0A372LUE2_9ACTN|nr:nitroreductase [Streptomyces triticagri]RFU82286.1 nitroreductase [Streptomyces triticagri]
MPFRRRTPSPALDADQVAEFVRAATTAPSLHNSQPWLFRYDRRREVLQVRADPSRRMAAADPSLRSLHISVGAALFNLRVAVARSGRVPETRLLPDPRDPLLSAEVHLGESLAAAADEGEPARDVRELSDLHPALLRRHTSRAPFSDERVAPALLDGLRGAALVEGTRLAFPDPFHCQTIASLAAEAEMRESDDPARRAELGRWTGDPAVGGGRRRDGIPAFAFGPRPRGGGAPVRDFDPTGAGPLRESVRFEESAQLALIGTVRDRPEDWLRAGQAMERVLLRATLDGLATSVATHVLEEDGIRWAVRDPSAGLGFVQMVIRFGYGPEGPATRRRRVDEVLSFTNG